MLALNETLRTTVLEPVYESSEKETLRFSPGNLVEISGPDARKQAATLLEAYPACPAAWIEQNLEPFPDEVRRYRLNFNSDSRWADILDIL